MSRMAWAMSFWQPMASIDTNAPSSSNSLSSLGMAVISLDLSSTATCPKVRELAPTQALTRCRQVPSRTTAATQGLAIDLDLLDSQAVADGVDPGGEAVLEDGRGQVAEEVAEGIVGGDAVGQGQPQGTQPGFLGAAKGGHVLEAFGPGQQGAQGDGQDVAQAGGW